MAFLLGPLSERTFAEGVLLLRDLCPAHRFDAQKKWTKKKEVDQKRAVVVAGHARRFVGGQPRDPDCPPQSAGDAEEVLFRQKEASYHQDADCDGQKQRGHRHRDRASRPKV